MKELTLSSSFTQLELNEALQINGGDLSRNLLFAAGVIVIVASAPLTAPASAIVLGNMAVVTAAASIGAYIGQNR